MSKFILIQNLNKALRSNLFLVYLLILFFIPKIHAQEDPLINKSLSPQKMQEDFELYVKVLKETHPGIYRYNSPKNFQNHIDQISAKLKVPMRFYDFHTLLLSLNAEIRCAHSYIVPTKNIADYLNRQVKTLPFYLYPIDGKLYVLFNGTSNENIRPGFEVIDINNRPVSKVINTLKKYYWSDGYNESNKEYALQGKTFRMFYYLVIEQANDFKLKLKNLEGNIITEIVKPNNILTSLKNYKSNLVNKQMWESYAKPDGKNWGLKLLDDPLKTAYFRFLSFSAKGANSEKKAAIEMRKFMDKSLKKIKNNNCENLIIDLRDNPGGWDVLGSELLSYFLKSDTSIRYYNKLYAKTDSSEFFKYTGASETELANIRSNLTKDDKGRFLMNEKLSSGLKEVKPKPNRFKGKVYALMNEKSGSAAAEFLAMAKANNIGMFIGKESGGAYEGGNSGSFINMSLPNSGITINTPLVFYENGVRIAKNKGRGTMPDYEISFTLEDLLKGTDSQLEFVKQLIRGKNSSSEAY